MKFLIRTRTWNQPTRIYNRGGWHGSTAWTKWKTVDRFDAYDAAEAALNRITTAARGATPPQQAAIFYSGRPYRRRTNAAGVVLGIDHGAAALRR